MPCSRCSRGSTPSRLRRTTTNGGLSLTVDAVRYQVNKRKRTGVASTFLADAVEPGETLKVYVQKAHAFALPDDKSKPRSSWWGRGPAWRRSGRSCRSGRLRAHRARTGSSSATRKQATDFFYRDEFEALRKDGILTRLSLAWSRDAGEKFYVQDRMREVGPDLWRWLEEGAHVYVCGDAKRMAKDVEAALVDIVGTKRQEDLGGGRGVREQAQEGRALPARRLLSRDALRIRSTLSFICRAARDQSRACRERDALVDLAKRQRDPEVGKVETSVHVLDHALHPAPLRVPRPVDHLGRVGFDEHDMVEARNRLVFSDLLDRVEIPRPGRQDFHHQAGCGGLEPVRIAMPAIHAEIGPADLTGERLDYCRRP